MIVGPARYIFAFIVCSRTLFAFLILPGSDDSLKLVAWFLTHNSIQQLLIAVSHL